MSSPSLAGPLRSPLDHLLAQNRARIDAEIKGVDAPSYSLLRERNQCNFLAHLPTELLREIMTHLCEMCMAGPKVSALAWRFVAHTCHFLRVVALGHAGLWAHVNYSFPRWTAATLDRARDVTLMVTLNTEHIGLYRNFIMQIMAEEMDRTRRIHLQSSDGDEFIPLQQQSPHLESVYLSTSRGFIIDTKLFDGVAPKLREIHLNGCTMPSSQSIPAFRGLITLSLDSVWLVGSAASFISLIESMENLKWLSIRRLWQSSFSDEKDSVQIRREKSTLKGIDMQYLHARMMRSLLYALGVPQERLVIGDLAEGRHTGSDNINIQGVVLDYAQRFWSSCVRSSELPNLELHVCFHKPWTINQFHFVLMSPSGMPGGNNPPSMDVRFRDYDASLSMNDWFFNSEGSDSLAPMYHLQRVWIQDAPQILFEHGPDSILMKWLERRLASGFPINEIHFDGCWIGAIDMLRNLAFQGRLVQHYTWTDPGAPESRRSLFDLPTIP
jgi:hypothetical protein